MTILEIRHIAHYSHVTYTQADSKQNTAKLLQLNFLICFLKENVIKFNFFFLSQFETTMLR